jgi:uncharacterized protein (TIGR03067 family)
MWHHTRFSLLAFSFLFILGTAVCADNPGAADWEYRAVQFGMDVTENTRKLNELAAEGWEYVGPLYSNQVAFKRHRGAVQQNAGRKELAKWEGAWEAEGGEKMTIKGDRWMSAAPGGAPIGGKLKFIGISEQTIQVDMLLELGETKDKTCKAIFRLDGNILHYCGTYSDTRPSEFKTTEENTYYAWKRVLKKPI